MAESGPAIACRGVWKSYRIYHQRSHTLKEKILSRRNLYEDFWALRGIDLEVHRGTTMGIIGTNGSGKSTLLKTMARILTPNRGSLEVHGRMSPLLELGTGFHPELTGRENVYLGSSLLGQSRKQVDARYDEIVDFAGIESFMDSPVKNYSSGMYARLAFAVAISVDPEILLVDEVLSVGDEGFQVRCHQRMAELRENGATVVVVSHSLATVRALCSQVAWIDAGTVRCVGPAGEVVGNYLDSVHEGLLPTEAANGDTDRTGGRALTGAACVLDVSVRTVHGQPATSIHTGDAITISILATAPEALHDVSCGIAIHRGDDSTLVFGQNTHEADCPVVIDGDTRIEFAIHHLPLRPGAHTLTVALHDHRVNTIYDWHDKRYALLVRSDSGRTGAGAVHIDGDWRVAPATPVQAASA